MFSTTTTSAHAFLRHASRRSACLLRCAPSPCPVAAGVSGAPSMAGAWRGSPLRRIAALHVTGNGSIVAPSRNLRAAVRLVGGRVVLAHRGGWLKARRFASGAGAAPSSGGGPRPRGAIPESVREKNRNVAYYGVATVIIALGVSYASVPLYRIFCQVTGYGGTVQKSEKLAIPIDDDNDDDAEEGGLPAAGADALKMKAKAKKKKKVDSDDAQKKRRLLTVQFTAQTGDGLPWKFTPIQADVRLLVGETALAFYQAENLSNKPIVGVATYNVNPMKAGLYFNKVQCFCFDEQRLRPKESVDMPVFFFIDPQFDEDPRMDDVDEITLSYTFFPSTEDDDIDDDVE